MAERWIEFRDLESGWEQQTRESFRSSEALMLVPGCFEDWLPDMLNELERRGLVYLTRDIMPPHVEADTPSSERWLRDDIRAINMILDNVEEDLQTLTICRLPAHTRQLLDQLANLDKHFSLLDLPRELRR